MDNAEWMNVLVNQTECGCMGRNFSWKDKGGSQSLCAPYATLLNLILTKVKGQRNSNDRLLAVWNGGTISVVTITVLVKMTMKKSPGWKVQFQASGTYKALGPPRSMPKKSMTHHATSALRAHR